jgi:molybdate transport system substrate-binding protein
MTYFAKIIVLASVSALLSVVACAQGQNIRIAAAAVLKFAMAELSENFEKQTGTKVNVTYGSSGNFFSQMQNGAPFDLFFSADIEYPKKLEAAGLAEPETLYVTRERWKSLLDASVQKIVIANPEHAPYGRAAVAALQKAGIYESVKAKLVYGENISQAAQFVQSGNAQAGIVAMSLAVSPGMRDGKRWEIPAEMHPAIEQGAIVLKSARDKETARAFMEFVKSATGRAILAKYGFEVPEKSRHEGQR